MSERTLWKYEATIVYFLAGIGLFYGVSILISDFQDFSHLAAILPPIVAYCLPAYLFLILHWHANAASFARLRLTRRLNGLLLAAIGLAGAIVVALYVGADVYHGFFQGYISPLFPFDIFALYLAALLIGTYLAYKGFRMKDPSRHEYVGRSGGRLSQGLGDVFRPLYLIFALYDAGAILMGFGFAYYESPSFGFMIPLYGLMIYAALLPLLEEWLLRGPHYAALPAQKKKAVAWSLFGVSALLSALALAFFALKPDYLIENAIAYFPLDFMGSLNLAPYCVILPPLLATSSHLVALYARKGGC
jgi:hypothetical protein